MKKLFLFDAYSLIYRSYYVFLRNPRINSKGQNTSAIMGFLNTLNEILTKENPEYLGVAFDPEGPTFRHIEYPEYKAQREAAPEDIKLSVPVIKEILGCYGIPVLEVKGFEADDVIGTLSMKSAKMDIETYMLTPDKDYGQLVRQNVFMYRPSNSSGYEVWGPKQIQEKFGVQRPEQVIDLLGLMGDTSDNIPGCPGVGPKTAATLIKTYDSIENLIAHTGELKGKLKQNVEENKQQILFSKYLATIRTDVPIDLDLGSLKVTRPDLDALKRKLDELEFKGITERIMKTYEKKNDGAQKQLDLFGFFPTEEAGTEKNASFEDLKSTVHKYKLVDNEEEMRRLCDFFRTKDFLSLDTETTSTSAIDAELVGLSFSCQAHEAFYVPVSSNREEAARIVNIFKSVYEDPRILKIGQNIKYDYEVLRKYDVELKGEMFDTMLAHYILQPELHHSMDYMAEVLLNYKTIHIDELIGPRGKQQKNMRDLEPEKVYEYACEDADITLQLKEVLAPKLTEMGAYRLFSEVEMPLVPVLAEMELTGVRLDTDSLRETSKVLSERLITTERRIYELAGGDFNISSPRQVGEVLFGKLKLLDKPKKTKTGQYVTNEEVLQSLKHKHEIVDKILEYRGLRKLLNTYVDALPSLVNSRTGRIHTSFNQATTATGRLSSSDPNLQNIPVRGEDGKEIRKAFVPEPGCLFFSADYSQIELRVMAHLSGDENMIEAFRSGYDIHAATAAKIYHEDVASVSRDQRTRAKRANFGIIYGITVFGLAERLEISRDEAKELIEGYFRSFPKVHDYMEAQKKLAHEQGYVETLFGRRRYLPDINSRNVTVRNFSERNAINAPIQGTAADIIKVAMSRIFKRFRSEGIRSKMILQVHDELNFSVFPEEKEQVERIVLEEMQGAISLRVPLVADSGWGSNWLEAH